MGRVCGVEEEEKEEEEEDDDELEEEENTEEKADAEEADEEEVAPSFGSITLRSNFSRCRRSRFRFTILLKIKRALRERVCVGRGGGKG